MMRLLNLTEVSKILNVAKQTIYKWIHEKRIPYVKLGSRVMFKEQDIEKWINDNRISKGE